MLSRSAGPDTPDIDIYSYAIEVRPNIIRNSGYVVPCTDATSEETAIATAITDYTYSPSVDPSGKFIITDFRPTDTGIRFDIVVSQDGTIAPSAGDIFETTISKPGYNPVTCGVELSNFEYRTYDLDVSDIHMPNDVITLNTTKHYTGDSATATPVPITKSRLFVFNEEMEMVKNLPIVWMPSETNMTTTIPDIQDLPTGTYKVRSTILDVYGVSVDTPATTWFECQLVI